MQLGTPVRTQTQYTPVPSASTEIIEEYLQLTFSHKLFGNKPVLVDVRGEDVVKDFCHRFDLALSSLCRRLRIGGAHSSNWITTKQEVVILEGQVHGLRAASVTALMAELETQIRGEWAKAPQDRLITC